MATTAQKIFFELAQRQWMKNRVFLTMSLPAYMEEIKAGRVSLEEAEKITVKCLTVAA